MKYLLLFFTFCPIVLKAQSELKFDKRFVECEDRWVAFPKEEDGTYSYGFIYIDEQAGLTLKHEGEFTISDQGNITLKKQDSLNVKYRLQPNRVRVAFIPESAFNELNISAIPEWLKFYKTDAGSIQRLYRWGYFYNSWEEYQKALTYLEWAQKIDPNNTGIQFELAFAYNALEQYEKTIVVLESALKMNPKECIFYKELAYAQIHLGEIDRAINTYKTCDSICSDKTIKCEIAVNLAAHYYKLKDRDNIRNWISEAKKWNKNDDVYSKKISMMENNLLKMDQIQ